MPGRRVVKFRHKCHGLVLGNGVKRVVCHRVPQPARAVDLHHALGHDIPAGMEGAVEGQSDQSTPPQRLKVPLVDRAPPCGTGLYGFAAKPRFRVFALSGNDPWRELPMSERA